MLRSGGGERQGRAQVRRCSCRDLGLHLGSAPSAPPPTGPPSKPKGSASPSSSSLALEAERQVGQNQEQPGKSCPFLPTCLRCDWAPRNARYLAAALWEGILALWHLGDHREWVVPRCAPPCPNCVPRTKDISFWGRMGQGATPQPVSSLNPQQPSHRQVEVILPHTHTHPWELSELLALFPPQRERKPCRARKGRDSFRQKKGHKAATRERKGGRCIQRPECCWVSLPLESTTPGTPPTTAP